MYCLTEVISFCLSEKTLGIVFPAAFSFVNLGGIYLCPYGPEKYQSRSSSVIIIKAVKAYYKMCQKYPGEWDALNALSPH